MLPSGVTVMDKREDGGYATPFVEATNHDDTFVSRIREDITRTAVGLTKILSSSKIFCVSHTIFISSLV
jgi:aspartate-semialdehyde dehydrogenase